LSDHESLFGWFLEGVHVDQGGGYCRQITPLPPHEDFRHVAKIQSVAATDDAEAIPKNALPRLQCAGRDATISPWQRFQPKSEKHECRAACCWDRSTGDGPKTI
jgi:hypothetical protein